MIVLGFVGVLAVVALWKLMSAKKFSPAKGLTVEITKRSEEHTSELQSH